MTAARVSPGEPEQGPHELRGRVVLHEPDGFRLEHGGRRWSVKSDERPELGALVRVRGKQQDTRLLAVELCTLQQPARAFGHADSEWARGQQLLPALQRRHALLRAVRGFFDAAGFTEVETPTVVPSPGLELQLEALEVLGAAGGARRFLQTSPEYHMKRLLVAGLPRIYQLCKAYRRDEQGALHEPEFSMLEWYRAFADADAVMADTEQLVAHAARALLGSTRVPGRGGELDVSPPWERLPVREAFARYAGLALESVLPDEDRFYRVLVERIEPQLGRGKPVFLTRYPASMAALARLRDDDPSCADRFEAYVNGVELCNGFSELTDPVEQRRRFEADLARRAQQGRPAYPIDERFLSALEDGMPPSGGNALGFDRLLMLLLGAERLSDVVAFGAERA